VLSISLLSLIIVPNSQTTLLSRTGVKLNVDAGYWQDTGLMGCGVVMRDHLAAVILSAWKFMAFVWRAPGFNNR
jgi:hypothetical protein